MGVELRHKSRDLLPVATARAVRRHARRSLWPVVTVALAAAGALLWIRAPGDVARLLSPPWVVAPLIAVIGWGYAARRSHSRARAAFWVLSATAAGGLFAFVLGMEWWRSAGPVRAFPLTAYLLLLPHLGIALGVAAALGPRRRKLLGPTFATETLLLLLAGAAATLRMIVEPTLHAGVGGWIEPTTLAALQAASLIPVLAASLLVLRRSSALAPRSAILLFVATLAFSGAVFLSLTGLTASPFSPGDPSAHMWAAGWLVFAASGFAAREVAPTASTMLAGRKMHDTLRKLIVPGVAVFLAAAVLDLALGPEPRPETVLTVALLAAALALRTAHAASLADREAEQRRQLAHTEALVEVTHSLAGATDLDATLRVIAEAARSVFRTQGGGIELLSEDGRTLETRYAVGLSGNVVGLRFPVDGSFTGWVVRHGEPRATVDPSRDPFVQEVSRNFLGKAPMAAAPIQFRGETLGVLYACIRHEPFDPEELQLMGAMAQQAAIAIENARLFEQVTTLSLTDPLTGLANRRELERELEREFAAARRGRELAVAIFDLDGFKVYNDTHGHLAGDAALQAFADALRTETRAMNLTVRYGGDEFVALLAGSDVTGGKTFIERVRTRFAASVTALGRGELTVSAGLACYRDDMEEPGDMIRAADADLYRSKTRVST